MESWPEERWIKFTPVERAYERKTLLSVTSNRSRHSVSQPTVLSGRGSWCSKSVLLSTKRGTARQIRSWRGSTV
jgi:hypothetical protein